MPKIVDRGARRRQIADSYLELVSSHGIENVSTRLLAAELKMSTGALWHYFDSFDEVLSEAMEAVFEHTVERVAQQTEGRIGLEAFFVLIEQVFPLDAVTRDEALVVVGLWGRIATNAARTERQNELESHWHGEWLRSLREAVAVGELASHAPATRLADAFQVLFKGAQVESILRTELETPERQWQVIGTILEPWLTPEGAAKLAVHVSDPLHAPAAVRPPSTASPAPST